MSTWQSIWLLRARPRHYPGALRFFTAALEQAEQLMRAAERVGPAARPLPLKAGSQRQGTRAVRDRWTRASLPQCMCNAAGPSGRNREARTFTVPGVSHGGDGMRDVYAKLAWAEKHLADLMSLAREYLRPGGGDHRPLGIEFDNRRPPIVVARFIAEQPLPVEISLHAGDLVHNARTALDHTLARVKDCFGGDGRSGTFPITESDADWKGRIYPRRDGKRQRGPLDGLPCSARMLIYREQPHVAYAGRRQEDPIAILSGMDNTDKHRLLQHGFAYPAAQRGLDLIQVRNRKMVLSEENVWVSSQPIAHGTVMARFRIRGPAEGLLRVDPNAEIKLATGPFDAPRTTYDSMIARVRGIADKANALIDNQP